MSGTFTEIRRFGHGVHEMHCKIESSLSSSVHRTINRRPPECRIPHRRQAVAPSDSPITKTRRYRNSWRLCGGSTGSMPDKSSLKLNHRPRSRPASSAESLIDMALRGMVHAVVIFCLTAPAGHACRHLPAQQYSGKCRREVNCILETSVNPALAGIEFDLTARWYAIGGNAKGGPDHIAQRLNTGPGYRHSVCTAADISLVVPSSATCKGVVGRQVNLPVT